jgi:hypothetical protein
MLQESSEPLREEEYPDPDEDHSQTVPCRACGEEIYDDAPQCHYCGDYGLPASDPWSQRPLWWIWLGLLGIAAAVASLTTTF